MLHRSSLALCSIESLISDIGLDQTIPTDHNLCLAPFQPVLRSEFGKKSSSPQAQHLLRHISPSSGAGKSSRHTEHAAPSAASTASKASAPGSATNFFLSCLWNQLSQAMRFSLKIVGQVAKAWVFWRHFSTLRALQPIAFLVRLGVFGRLTFTRCSNLPCEEGREVV